VTVPVGAFISSFVFDVLTHTRANGLPYLVDGAYWLIGVGLIGALLAAVFGALDFVTIPRGTRAFRIGLRHIVLNAVVAALFLVGFAWRAGDHLELEKTRWGQMVLSGAAVVLLVISAWLGVSLSHRFGVRVVDQSGELPRRDRMT
jgi:uncharacterized membrane protein